jgi:hypothetical protein
MAIEWDIYLGTTGPTGKISPFGRKVMIARNETVRQQRTADGTLKTDILYVKHEWKLSFKNITESALDTLDYWYDYYKTNKEPLPLYMFTSDVAYDEFSVVPEPVDRTRVVKSADNLYSGVTFNLVEV